MPQHKRVALIVETATSYGRSILTGVAHYLHRHQPWACFLTPSTGESFPKGLRGWQGDGVIATIYSHQVLHDIRKMNVPLVNVAHGLPDLDVPQVLGDNLAVGRLVAEHFIDAGFPRLAYLGFTDLAYSIDRRIGFEEAAREAGVPCLAHWPKPAGEPDDWEQHRQRLEKWVSELEKPVGIMACHDLQGRALIQVCQRAGVRVPEEVAVVGVDDDQVLCELCHPPLSSVDQAADNIGFEAARLLDRLMAGEAPPETPLRIPPRFLVTRPSSDTVAVDDHEVAEALRFIRENARRPIRVEDLLEHVPLARRTLERRFMQAIGRLPAAEIRRVHVNLARRLLIQTDFTLALVARNAGFIHAKSLHDIFTRECGVTPSEYREKFRRRI